MNTEEMVNKSLTTSSHVHSETGCCKFDFKWSSVLHAKHFKSTSEAGERLLIIWNYTIVALLHFGKIPTHSSHFALNLADKFIKTDQKSWLTRTPGFCQPARCNSNAAVHANHSLHCRSQTMCAELHVNPQDLFSGKGSYISQDSDFTLKELIAFQQQSDNSAKS